MKYVKFCGIRRDEDVTYVNELLPDFIGIIFYEKSHRNVTINQAKKIKGMLTDKIKAVGVFVDKPEVEVIKICETVNLDMIQLHGQEESDYINTLRKYIDIPVIKAVRYQFKEQLFRAEKLPVDYLLIDTYSKAAAGGTGKAFDWREIPPLEKPYFLAGGIDKDNIEEALKTNAFALDISSGIETDRIKDFDKMKTLIDIVKH